MIPKGTYFKLSIEGIGVAVRDEDFNMLREKALKEVERKRDRAINDQRELEKAYSSLLRMP